MDLFDLAYLAFGLGFFLFVTRMIARDHRESEERRIMEQREFGIGSKNQRKSRKFLQRD